MSESEPDLPTDNWDLPAPESHVLLYGLDARSIQPFKLALTELVARKTLRMVDVSEPAVFNRIRTVTVIAKGSAAVPDAASLLAVYRLFERVPERVFVDGTIGVELDELAIHARQHYHSLYMYTVREVMPTLVARGYYTQSGRLFGFIGSVRYVLTPAGESARQGLQARVAEGRNEFSGWVRTEPNRARLYLENAGPSLLLMPFLYDDIQGLPPVDSRHAERTWLMDGAIGPPPADSQSERRHLEAESYQAGELPVSQWAIDSIPTVHVALESSFSDVGYATASSGGYDASGAHGGSGGDGGGSGGDGGGGGGGGGGD